MIKISIKEIVLMEVAALVTSWFVSEVIINSSD
jgi:hypothetical protein